MPCRPTLVFEDSEVYSGTYHCVPTASLLLGATSGNLAGSGTEQGYLEFSRLLLPCKRYLSTIGIDILYDHSTPHHTLNTPYQY